MKIGSGMHITKCPPVRYALVLVGRPLAIICVQGDTNTSSGPGPDE